MSEDDACTGYVNVQYIYWGVEKNGSKEMVECSSSGWRVAINDGKMGLSVQNRIKKGKEEDGHSESRPSVVLKGV